MLFRFSVAVVFVSSLFAQNIPAPQALTVVAASAAQVDLRWTGNNSATGYSIERKTMDGSYAAVLTATGTTVSDKTIDPYTTYVYRVRGTTQGNSSDPSNEVTVGPPPYGYNTLVKTPSKHNVISVCG